MLPIRMGMGTESHRHIGWGFCFVTFGLIATVGWLWLPVSLSGQELADYVGRMLTVVELWARDGRLTWWNPTSMGGYSIAGVLSYGAALPLYVLLAQGFEPVVAFKLGALIYWWTGGLAAFALGREITRSAWFGVAVGSFYLLSAQLILRTGWVEHMTLVACYPFVPLAFLGLWRTARRGAPLDFLLLAVSFSLVWLSASKIGATLAVGLAAVGMGLYLGRPDCRRGAITSGVLVFLLGLLPVLSLFREYGFMTVFSLAPFAEWQQIFSQPAVVFGLDRGDLLQGLPEPLLVARGGYYLTLPGILALLAVVWWNWREDKNPSQWLLPLRIFAGAALLLQWLSHGPRSVLGGQFFFLQEASGIKDWILPLVWFSLIGACLLLWWLVPRSPRHPRLRGWIYAGLLAVYLLVPGFRILELLPPFANLRAPDSFWILAGTLCWSATAGLALGCLLASLPKVRWRILGGFASGILLLAGAALALENFVRERMPATVMDEFHEAMTVLDADSHTGWVLPLSGRYFYMQIPWKSSKPLWTEAGHSNFMLKGMAKFQTLGWSDPVLLRDTLRLGSVRYILVDRNDPDLNQEQAKRLEQESETLYEGREILLLRNLRALPFAYRATKWLRGGDSVADLVAGLSLAEFSVAFLPDSQSATDSGGNLPEIHEHGEFLPLDFSSTDSGHWRIQLDGEPGLAILAMAWHPDWRARIDGKDAPVEAAWGALCAVETKAGSRELELRFEPPWWYGAAFWSGLGCWGLTLLGLLAWPVYPRAWKAFLADSREIPTRPPTPPAQEDRVAILIPTHNECSSIERIIREIFTEFPDGTIWIVDDVSTDGTREILHDLQKEFPELRVIERPSKAGLGSAYRAAMSAALSENFSVIVTMDGDGSHHPGDAKKLRECVRDGRADAAVGSRYLPGSRVENWPRTRLWLSRGATWYVRAWTGLPLTDATSGLKALRADALRAVCPETLRADGYAFQIELHFRLWQAGFVLTEQPVIFTEREGGHSKMNPGIVREAVWRVPALVWKR